MESTQIRKVFLDFFAERGHTVVPSSSLVPDDPTLLLTNAGMVQFKPYFLGDKPAPYLRAASVQKCFREIDLEEVGKTARHMTFFEMLGNFSFGEYFKPDACIWAWELMTDGFALDPERLWATVYETDDEAFDIWETQVGVPVSRILRRTRADGNFWDMGVAGPCGPCSELLYDRGPDFGKEYTGGVLDEERYLEVWNLVFMQNVMNDAGDIVGNLPNKNVDTGMGLERLASILQGVSSVFEIDTTAAILEAAQQITGHTYHAAADTDVSLRVLSEHARSMSFLIADGVLPGNVGRGYVLRRLIRRAVRYARLAGVDTPVLSRLAEVVVDIYSSSYPELDRNHELIRQVVDKEEARFDLTLRQGLGLLEEEIARSKSEQGGTISGEVAFKLHDTYGFPLDLTVDIASEEGIEVDRTAFQALMSEQRSRARSARGSNAEVESGSSALQALVSSGTSSSFLGYERLTTSSEVIGLVKDGQGVAVLLQGEAGELVLNQTTFYAESGGQVGDRGEIVAGSGVFRVEDTKRGAPGLTVHVGHVVSGEFKVGDEVRCDVDASFRSGVTQSHTATHMIHWALRDHLGEHARQQGSLVEPGRLRFDFSHFEPVSGQRLVELESEVNSRVLANDLVHHFETSFDEAQAIGAMSLFGEKYGDVVRVVEVGDYSKELCGGTHVAQTGQVGVFKIVHEGSVAAGVRRIEALTGVAGLRHLNAQADKLKLAAEMLKTDPDRVIERLEKTLESMKQMQQSLAQLQQISLKAEVEKLIAGNASINGSRALIVHRRDASVEELRRFATMVREGVTSGVVVVGSVHEGKGSIVVAVSKDLVAAGVTAGEIAAAGAEVLGGGGGRQPDLAVAGGPETGKIDIALDATSAKARELLTHL